jgi:hypothetical protein
MSAEGRVQNAELRVALARTLTLNSAFCTLPSALIRA